MNATERRSRRRRGSVAVLTALTIVMLLGFAALVVDVGNLYRVRGELQNAADAAALAGARHLDGSGDGIDAARQAAFDYAEMHSANNAEVLIKPDLDVHFGFWDSEMAEQLPGDREPAGADPFTDMGADPADPEAVNAVRVFTQRSEERADPVKHFFAQFLGTDESNVSTPAIAVAGGPMDACGFPLVVGECSLQNADVGGLCEYCLVFHDDGSDNAGFTSFADKGGVGNPEIKAKIEEACFKDNLPNINENGECDNDCSNTQSGKEIQVQNGTLMSSSQNNFCALIQQIVTRDGVDNPQSFRVKAPVLRTGQKDPAACNDAFKGKQKVDGYAVLEIFGARCGKPDTNPPMAPGAPSYCEDTASNEKYIVAALRCDAEPVGLGGGGFHGLQALNMRLVR